MPLLVPVRRNLEKEKRDRCIEAFKEGVSFPLIELAVVKQMDMIACIMYILSSLTRTLNISFSVKMIF